mmetsp:Transcript_19397/g.61735  ORF Transcript_19397/g.61735 Transcript_19397/m.61735 type:complete len:208 (+) Transcript_19397:1229-1852(+)
MQPAHVGPGPGVPTGDARQDGRLRLHLRAGPRADRAHHGLRVPHLLPRALPHAAGGGVHAGHLDLQGAARAAGGEGAAPARHQGGHRRALRHPQGGSPAASATQTEAVEKDRGRREARLRAGADGGQGRREGRQARRDQSPADQRPRDGAAEGPPGQGGHAGGAAQDRKGFLQENGTGRGGRGALSAGGEGARMSRACKPRDASVTY